MKHVYLAEDDENISSELDVVMFKGAGYDVEKFENGRLLIERYNEEVPDAVITDYSMPEINGLGVVKHIRDRGDMIPIIVHSGYSQLPDLDGYGCIFVKKALIGMNERLIDALDKALDQTSSLSPSSMPTEG